MDAVDAKAEKVQYFPQVTIDGAILKLDCPFCGESAGLKAFPSTQEWACLHCGRAGRDVWDWQRAMLELEVGDDDFLFHVLPLWMLGVGVGVGDGY